MENLDDSMMSESKPPGEAREPPDAEGDGQVQFDSALDPEVEAEKIRDATQDVKLRAWRINTKLLKKYGYSDKCKGVSQCRWARLMFRDMTQAVDAGWRRRCGPTLTWS